MINPLKFFKSRAALVRIINRDGHAITAYGQEVRELSGENHNLKVKNAALEAQNAEYRRIIGGYKAGQTRRERKAIVNPQ